LIAAVAVVLALLVPGAQANTVVVGSQLTTPGFSLEVFGPLATVTNSALPAPMTAASPVDGTVTNWSVIGSGQLTPRVIRPTGGGTYTGAGTGTPKGATSGGVSGPFQTSLPIKAGDLFGVDGQSPAQLAIAPNASATNLYFEPALANGAGAVAPVGTNPGGEDAISATVRFCLVPKLKGKSPEQARDALHAANCKVGPKRKGKKRTKRKKVIKQTIKAGTSVSDQTAVGFTVSRKRPKK
jgi:hypothetical protein